MGLKDFADRSLISNRLILRAYNFFDEKPKVPKTTHFHFVWLRGNEKH